MDKAASRSEQKLPRWRGKAVVLCLLGFAATAFVITITLSAADATAHIVENPFARQWAPHRIVLTIALIAALGAVFVRGLREAVWLAVTIVVVYIALNVIVVGNGLMFIVAHPETVTSWRNGLLQQQPNYLWPLPPRCSSFRVSPSACLGSKPAWR